MNDIYDVLTVGFGPAGLSIAIALDACKDHNLKVGFIEKQKEFKWHGGMLLDNAVMRISFMKDLATLRDPTSPFTFLNYLHKNNLLVDFINVGSMNPFRVQYDQYLRWVAVHFEELCFYDEEVIKVEPVLKDSEIVQMVDVTSRTSSGEYIVRRTRNLIIAAGGKPNIPAQFLNQDNLYKSEKIIHSSQFLTSPLTKKAVKAAVIGAGQSAAENFNELSQNEQNSVSLVFRDRCLRCVDDSPFVNEVFNPSSTDSYFEMAADSRFTVFETSKNTNYAVVEPEKLQEIYQMLYLQKITGKGNRCEIVPSSSIEAVTVEENSKCSLTLKNVLDPTKNSQLEDLDLIVLATGYTKAEYKNILEPLLHYFVPVPGQVVHKLSRNYQLETVNGFQVPIFLQGYCEETHGISDTLLSVTSIRGMEVVQAILNHLHYNKIINNIRPFTPIPLSRTSSEATISAGASPTQGNATVLEPIPSKPRPGSLLYTKFHPHLNETVTFHVCSVEDHLIYFNEWMNNPRVDEFWKEAGSLEKHIDYINKINNSAAVMPVIGSFNGVPFGYFEIYWVSRDPIGNYFDVQTYDRGIHMLVGSESHRGPHRVDAWLSGLIDFIRSDDPNTKRVISEPRSDNAKMISYLVGKSFRKNGLVQFPHKEAMIMILDL
ncbi:hypothetical protein HDV02_003936 [Globomyces sp. JEL0801]|nr:hypothetical protein HDV02_003936 [Globomyces sp. JEL0801]